MKVFVVLTLAVFSVCNANILWQDPKSNLEVVKDAFWDYVAKMTITAEESLKQIKQSELGQEMNARISESTEAVNRYITALQTQVAPLMQDFMARVSQEAEQLKARLEEDLSAVKTNLEPHMDVVAKLQEQVEELKKQTAPYAEAMDPEALKAVLLQRSQELKRQLDQSVSELRAQMVPYTDQMKQRMEQSLDDFHSSVVPLAQSFQTQLTQRTQEIQQNLAPFGQELRAKLDARAQELQAQLSTLQEKFTEQ